MVERVRVRKEAPFKSRTCVPRPKKAVARGRSDGSAEEEEVLALLFFFGSSSVVGLAVAAPPVFLPHPHPPPPPLEEEEAEAPDAFAFPPPRLSTPSFPAATAPAWSKASAAMAGGVASPGARRAEGGAPPGTKATRPGAAAASPFASRPALVTAAAAPDWARSRVKGVARSGPRAAAALARDALAEVQAEHLEKKKKKGKWREG